MQTFLPLPNLVDSAQVLDRQRLGKQRSEAKIILNLLTGVYIGGPWANHPAVLMWRGYETMLAVYGLNVCAEWRNRGYRDSLLPFFTEEVNHLSKGGSKMPWWFGRQDFHSSHRAALLFKDPHYYGQFGWLEKPGISYVWPTKIQRNPS